MARAVQMYQDSKELLDILDSRVQANKGCSVEDESWDQYYSFPRLYLSTSADENQFDPFVLQPSLFHKNNVPPTIYFNTKLSEDSRPPIGLPKRLQGSWCRHMLTADFPELEEWRKVNHFPGSFHIGRKDRLWQRLRQGSLRVGLDKFENFHPVTFVLPKDYEDLKSYWASSPNKLFIMKPPASARGNGVQVINNISQIPEYATIKDVANKKSSMIVQQYISNPCLLANGQKFDLRIYVLLTSIDPLRIYVYDDGLVRFASTKYTSQEDGIIDQFMHLTNYFINKNNRDYQINNDCESLNGCKWTLKRFWRYLEEHYTNVDTKQLWEQITDIIVKAVIFCEAPMARLSQNNCKTDYTSYELFGFDILLDEDFKPWILEVNITPSLRSESDLDKNVKYGVIKDMFNIVGYNLPPIDANDLNKTPSPADRRLFFDSRLYTANLTKRDKIKQIKYQKLFLYGQDRSQIGLSLRENGLSDDQDNDAVSITSQLKNGEHEAIKKHEDDNHIGLSATQNNDRCNSLNDPLHTSDSILTELTQNDVRVLMLAEDELSRCGQFKRVFPSPTSRKYLNYFEKSRYYNLLLDSWEQKYKDKRTEGIARLSDLAKFLN